MSPVQVAHVLFGLAFLYSAAVQYNDPDGFYWGAWYAGAAATAFTAVRRPKAAIVPAAILGLGSLGGMLSIALHGPSPVTLAQLFGGLAMKTDNVELWREGLGLAIIAGWMGVVFGAGVTRRAAPTS